MSAADIYFLPSSWEGIALSFYEAMSMELAVVGAIVGGQLELVLPDCGILLPRSDEHNEVEAYADTLGSLLDDPGRIAMLGRNARARIETGFTLDRMGDRMVELFNLSREYHDKDPRQRLTPGLARETATQVVEFFRVQLLCEELWNQRQRATSARAKSSAETQQLQGAVQRRPASVQAALSELADIEASRAWRVLQSIKRSPFYSLVGRYRYGSNWSLIDPNEPPEYRLARIKNSNTYRFISRVKRSRAYRLYEGLGLRQIVR